VTNARSGTGTCPASESARTPAASGRDGSIGLSAFDLHEVSGAQACSAPRRNTMPAIPKRPGAYNDYDYARAEYR